MFDFWFGGVRKIESENAAASPFTIDPTIFKDHEQISLSKSPLRVKPPPPLRRKTSNVILPPVDTDDEDEEDEAGKAPGSVSRSMLMSPSPDSHRSILSVFEEFHPPKARKASQRKLFAPPSESSFCTTLSHHSSGITPQQSSSATTQTRPVRRFNVICAPDDSDDEDGYQVSTRTKTTRRTKRTSSDLDREDFDDLMFLKNNKRATVREARRGKRRFLEKLRTTCKDPDLGDKMMHQFSLQHKAHVESLHDLRQDIQADILTAKAHLGNALQGHCKRQENILRNYESHQAKLREEAEKRAQKRARALEEKRKAQENLEQERRAREHSEYLDQEARKKAEALEKAKADARNKGAVKKWKTRIDFMKQARQKADAFKAANKIPALKLRGSIGRVVNQISATQKQIQKCVGVLQKIISGASDESIAYIAVTMIDRLINSCGKKICLQQDLAYCYGYVLYGISAGNGFLAKLILCSLSDRCPFTIPYFPRLSNCNSTVEFLQTMRRREITDKGDSHVVIEQKMWEPEEKYYERMRGFMGIFAGYIDVCQANPARPDEGKKFLTRVSRILHSYPAYPASIAPAICSVLEVAGHSLQQRYPQEFSTFLKHLVADMAKFPKDSTLRQHHVKALGMLIKASQTVLAEPKGRKIHADLQVRQQDIVWNG